MPSVVARYHRQFPRIKVKVLDSSAHDVLSAVVNGEADFGLSFMGTQEGHFVIRPDNTMPGTSLDASNAIGRRVERILLDQPEAAADLARGVRQDARKKC